MEWVGTEGDTGTLLDVAKWRRNGDPGGENVEEMIQLLQDRCPFASSNPGSGVVLVRLDRICGGCGVRDLGRREFRG